MLWRRYLRILFKLDEGVMFKLKRVTSTPQAVCGVLMKDDKPLCVTLENPWLNNIPRESCIPKGTYQCRKFSGTKYKDVWELDRVPGRSAILIHQGNTAKDTMGCILVGKGFADFGGEPGVTDSRVTLDMLRVTLPDSFTLVIE